MNEEQILLPIDKNWTDDDNGHQGGISTGIGYTIAWQRGSIQNGGRNGAFLIEVLGSCLNQLEYFQDSQFACIENEYAMQDLNSCIGSLQKRLNRRRDEGVLGTQNT